MSKLLAQSLSASSATAKDVLGAVRWVGNKAYRYVQFKDAVTYADGQAVAWDDKDAFLVTNDASSAEGEKELAGICLYVAVQDEYGYILCVGDHATAQKEANDDNMVAGTVLIFDGTNDGSLKTYNPAIAGAPTDAELFDISHGHAVATGASDDTGDTVPIRLVNCL